MKGPAEFGTTLLKSSKEMSAAAGAAEEKFSCELGSAKFYFLCSVSGAPSTGLTHMVLTPLDLVKCRLQVNKEKYKSLGTGFKLTFSESGVKGLSLGWAPTCIGYNALGFVKFGLYEMFKKNFSGMVGEERAFTYRTSLYLAASAAAEFFAVVALSPMEACKVRMQTSVPGNFPTTLRSALPHLAAEEGLSGFYKSLPALWGRQIPYTMMKFACFERTVEALYRHVVPKPRSECSKGEQLVVTFAAGYIAGVFCATVSHPADSVVSYMNKAKGSGLGASMRALGLRGMWAGLGPRILMIGTQTALQWLIYDGMKVWLRLPRPPPPLRSESHQVGLVHQ